MGMVTVVVSMWGKVLWYSYPTVPTKSSFRII